MAETQSETLTPLTAAPAPYIDILRTVFPVVAVQPEESGQIARPDFFGTDLLRRTRSVHDGGPRCDRGPAHGNLALAGPGASADDVLPMGSATVTQVEVFRDRDIALPWCNAPQVTLLNTWLVDRTQVLTDVSSFGYPHAVTWSREGLEVAFRARMSSELQGD